MRRIALLIRRRLGWAVAAVLLLAAGPAAAQTITWQMANEYPATFIHGEGDQFFARELWERSGGRIVITHSFDASLGYRSTDLLQAVARGTVVLGDMYVGERQWAEIRNRVAVNYERMRVTIDEWRAKAGPTGQEILDDYTKKLNKP